MIDYQIDITMSPNTVTSLLASGNYLYQFGVVQTSDQATQPTVWGQTNQYLENTKLSWTDFLQGYIGSEVGNSLNIGLAVPIQLGEILSLTSPGVGKVLDDGVQNSIAIQNATVDPYSCGIKQGEGDLPVCVLPLYGNGFLLIQPVAATFLMFSPVQLPSGGIAKSVAQGMLIDLSDSPTREVLFDINLGWSNNGESWGQVFSANTDLPPILSAYSPNLATQAATLALNVT